MPSSLTYTIPTEFVGKTLSDIRDTAGQRGFEGFRPDLVARELGIPENTRLSAGNITASIVDPNQFESQHLRGAFGNPLTTEQLASQAADTQTNQLVKSAKALRDFTIQSNQPAVQQYQKQLTPGDPSSIQDRYDKIIANIKGQGTVATNDTTRAITSSLGARGLLPNSPEGQRALAEGLLPVETQFGGLEAQAGYQNVQDINQLNNAIAALQTGNPIVAQQTGLGLGQIGAGLQAAQLQAQTAIQNARLQAETQRKIAEQEFQYRPIFPGGALYNTQNQQTIIPGASIGNTKDPVSLYYAWLAQQQK